MIVGTARADRAPPTSDGLEHKKAAITRGLLQLSTFDRPRTRSIWPLDFAGWQASDGMGEKSAVAQARDSSLYYDKSGGEHRRKELLFTQPLPR